MKKFIKIIICALLSIAIQCGVLLYLDKVLFKESTEFTIENVDIAVKSVDADVAIPTNAKKVEVSYNGRYITYYVDNKFMLIDTKTAKVTQILENTEILTTQWVPNNNIILIVEKASNKINVKTYNANNGFEQPVREICPYKKGMKVNVVISNLTSTKYICINNGEGAQIYRVDINEDMKELDSEISVLGSVKVFGDKDVLLYEDSSNKNFYRYNNGKITKLNFQNPKNLVILAAANNKVYMGEASDQDKDKITKIIYGDDQTDPATWATVNLETPKEIKDIFISDNSEIFINDSLQGKVKNITSGNNITYEGRFISVNNKVVCSSDNGKVYLKSITDVDKTQEITKQK